MRSSYSKIHSSWTCIPQGTVSASITQTYRAPTSKFIVHFIHIRHIFSQGTVSISIKQTYTAPTPQLLAKIHALKSPSSFFLQCWSSFPPVQTKKKSIVHNQLNCTLQTKNKKFHCPQPTKLHAYPGVDVTGKTRRKKIPTHSWVLGKCLM